MTTLARVIAYALRRQVLHTKYQEAGAQLVFVAPSTPSTLFSTRVPSFSLNVEIGARIISSRKKIKPIQ